MLNQPQHELFAEPPVRSSYGRQPSGPKLSRAGMAAIGAIVLVIAGTAGYFLSDVGGEQGEIPTITADGPVKERPDQPGGIDIPHQDVTVFQQLEKNDASADNAGPVEHLLPNAEAPQEIATETRSSAMPQFADETESVAQGSTIGKAGTNILPPKALSDQIAKDIENSRMAQPETTVGGNQGTAGVAASNQATTATAPVKNAAVEKPVKKAERAETEKVKAKVVDKVAEPAKVKSEAPAVAKSVPATQTKTTTASLPSDIFTANPDEISKVAKAAKESEKKASPVVSDVTASAKGSAAVQLASIPDEAKAEGVMKTMQTKFASALGGASLRLVKADIPGKGIYYRVQTTPMADASAKSVCEAVKAAGGSCLVAR